MSGSVNNALPEQGYHGRPVKHKDLKTMTDDWRLEFGKNGPESAFRACLKNRQLYWCKKHMRELQSAEWQGDYAPGGRYGPETFDAAAAGLGDAPSYPAEEGRQQYRSSSQGLHRRAVLALAAMVSLLATGL